MKQDMQTKIVELKRQLQVAKRATRPRAVTMVINGDTAFRTRFFTDSVIHVI